jgi:hypothetical protein
MHPPVLPPSLTPEVVIRHLSMRGNDVLEAAEGALDVVSRELVPTATDAVLERVDVTDLVLKQVDLVRIVDAVLDRIDLTELVLQRVDLDRLIAAADLDAAAARLDVDAVAQRLDVDAVAARLDVNAVAARLNPAAVGDFLVEAIDLPEIIRTSTGSVAAGAVHEARVHGTEAYGQAKRVVGRVPLLHREPEPELEPEPTP